MGIIRFELIGGEPPKIVNWNKLIDELEVHAILPILGTRKKELIMPTHIQQRVNSAITHQLYYFTKIAHEQQIIVDKLGENGINPTILKGLSAAQYYRIPELRTMGDIDILIQSENDFNKAVDVVLELGYTPIQNYGNLTYQDTVNSSLRHFEFKKNELELEIHSRFAEKDSIIEQYLRKADKNMCNIGKWRFMAFNSIENGLVLLQHIMFHLPMDGVGLRLILDWINYLLRVLDDEVWNTTFSKVAEECGLKKLAICLTRTCELYFGVPEHEFSKEAEVWQCEELIFLIGCSGNFGRSLNVISRKSKQLIKPLTALRNLQIKGKNEWAFCKRHRAIIPFAWVYAMVGSIKNVLISDRGLKSVANGMQYGEKFYHFMDSVR